MGKSGFTYQRTGNPAVDAAMQLVAGAFARVDQAAPLNVVQVNEPTYAANGSEDIIVVNRACKLALPNPVKGWVVSIIAGSRANSVAITTTSPAVPFDGETPGVVTLGEPYASAEIACDGSAYYVIGGSAAGPVIPPIPPFPPIPGGGATGVDGVFPIIVNGGGTRIVGKNPWQNKFAQYVSSTGNDNNDGLGWDTAKQTQYAGYAAVVAAGGGTLRLGDSCPPGGPVANQGLWIRGDGANIPGFLPAVSCIIEGSGQTLQILFERPGQVAVPGGSNLDADFRNKPGIWLTSILNAAITFRNIKPVPAPGAEAGIGQNHYLPWRMGWDFNRNALDGSIQYLTISSSQRASGISTHTTSLTAGVAIQSATRTAGVVRVTIPRPPGEAKFPPWTADVPVWIESSDPANFPSGAFVVANPAADYNIQLDWSFSYTQAGADHTTANMGEVRSPITKDQHYVDLESNNAQFPSGRYKTTAVAVVNSTTATISVRDINGGHGGCNPTQGPTANIGQMSHEERGFTSLNAPSYENCSNYIANVEFIGKKFGPGFDLGANVAIGNRMTQCAVYGWYPSPGYDVPWDEDRHAAVFGYGNDIFADCNLVMQNCTGNQAEIVVIGGASSAYYEIDCLFDSSTGYAPPPYNIDGRFGDVTVHIVQALVADANTADPIITRVAPLQISGQVPMSIQCTGPASDSIGSHTGWIAGEIAQNPWVNLQSGTWADGRITGKHPAAERGISPVTARFQNLAFDPSLWENKTVGSGITAGIDDPMGGTGAYRLDSAGGVNPADAGVIVRHATDTFFAVGGHVVIAAWMRPGDAAAGKVFQPTAAASTEFTDALFEANPPRWFWPMFIDGWEFMVFSTKMISGNTTQNNRWTIEGPPVGSGLFVDFFAPTLHWIPPSVADNDVAEYVGTLKALPQYLPPAMAGTFEGQKFIAHGGVGVDATVLTTPSGTASATKNLPLLKSDGTVQGYIPVIPTNDSLPTGTGTVTSVGATAPITTTGGTTPSIGVTDFVASGASHARGTVPDPGAVAGTTKFLREDATFAVPPATALNGKIWVDATDAAHNALDYLYNKLTSFTGTISFAPIGSNDVQLTIDTVYKPNKIVSYYVLTSIPGSAGGWLATSVSTGFSALFAVIEYALLEAMIAIQVDVVVSQNSITGTGTTDIDFVATQNGTLGSIGGTIPYGSTGVFTSGKVSVGGTATSDTWGVAALNHGTVTGGTLTATIVLTAFY